MVKLPSSFELESEALDRDHQKMVNQVNAIIKKIDAGKTDDCQAQVAEFAALSKRHFAREEALLVSVNYPDVEKHRKHHLDLDVKLDHMLEFAKMAPENDMACKSLKKELVYFIMDDVITTDLEFKEFLSET
jgi:hemerythrin-like metal-binding protein